MHHKIRGLKHAYRAGLGTSKRIYRFSLMSQDEGSIPMVKP